MPDLSTELACYRAQARIQYRTSVFHLQTDLDDIRRRRWIARIYQGILRLSTLIVLLGILFALGVGSRFIPLNSVGIYYRDAYKFRVCISVVLLSLVGLLCVAWSGKRFHPEHPLLPT